MTWIIDQLLGVVEWLMGCIHDLSEWQIQYEKINEMKNEIYRCEYGDNVRAPAKFNDLTQEQKDRVLDLLMIPEFNDIVVPFEYGSGSEWEIGVRYCAPGDAEGWMIWASGNSEAAERGSYLLHGGTVAKWEEHKANKLKYPRRDYRERNAAEDITGGPGPR